MPDLSVHRVDSPISVYELFPTFRFQLDTPVDEKAALSDWEDFTDFVATNLSLIPSRESLDGFRLALALVRLYIDTKHLSPKEVHQNAKETQAS